MRKMLKMMKMMKTIRTIKMMKLKKTIQNNVSNYNSLQCSNFIFHNYFLTVPGTVLGARILSDTSFASLEGIVSDLTLQAIEKMGYTKMTEIQVILTLTFTTDFLTLV